MKQLLKRMAIFSNTFNDCFQWVLIHLVEKIIGGKFCIILLFQFLMNISATFKTLASTRDCS